VAFGFIFLSVTLFAGIIEQKASGETIRLFEPRLISLIVIWIIYGASIFVRPITGWDLKHMAYLFIALFIFITALILLMTIFSPSFHGLVLEHAQRYFKGAYI